MFGRSTSTADEPRWEWVWVKPIAAIAQIVSGMHALVWTELATDRSKHARLTLRCRLRAAPKPLRSHRNHGLLLRRAHRTKKRSAVLASQFFTFRSLFTLRNLTLTSREELAFRRKAHGRKSPSGSEISSRTPSWVIAKSKRRSAWVISA